MQKKAVIVVVLAFLGLIMMGCGEQKMYCAPPSVYVGDACCIDADKDDACDPAKEERLVEDVVVDDVPDVQEFDIEVDEGVQSFADTFTQTWNRKSYTALHSLFSKDLRLKFSPQEFNFLARKVDGRLGVQGMEIIDGDDYFIDYLVVTAEGEDVFTAPLKFEDGRYVHEAFYMFSDLSADSACEGNASCFVSYAKISGDRNYCDKAEGLKAECLSQFGLEKGLTEKISECASITDYYGMCDCLTQLAVKENDIEPCWSATFDKQIYECMGEVAAARKDVDECKTFISSRGFPGSRLQYTYCLLSYVRLTGDTKACAKIDRRDDVMLGSMQEGCYRMMFP